MLSKKDKDEILRLRHEEDLTYKAIHEKTNFSINKIMNVCKGKVEESQKEEAEEKETEESQKEEAEEKETEESQKEEAKKQEVHFDDPIEQVRAIPKAIDNLIEKEQLKEGDRVEWEKRIEDVRDILRIEVDERIAGERKDAIDKRDEEWREHLKKNYEKKEVAIDLRSILEEKNTTIKALTETIEEKDNLITDIKAENTNLNNEKTGLNNENINLRYSFTQLEEYKEKYLEDAGRRERRRLEKERGDFIVEKTEFMQYVWEKKQEHREKEEELNNKIIEEKKIKKENIERKKELDELQEKIREGAKANENLISRADITLKEIKIGQDLLGERQKQVERLESVQSREKNVEWQEQKIAKEKQFEEKKEKLQSEEEIHKMIDRFTGPVEGIDFIRVKLEPA